MRGIKIFKRFGVIALQPVRAGHEIAAAFLPAARFGTGGEEDEIAILGVKLGKALCEDAIASFCAKSREIDVRAAK